MTEILKLGRDVARIGSMFTGVTLVALAIAGEMFVLVAVYEVRGTPLYLENYKVISGAWVLVSVGFIGFMAIGHDLVKLARRI